MGKGLFFLFLTALSLLYIFDIDRLIVRNFNYMSSFKEFYINNGIKLTNFTETYIAQITTIEKLQDENLKLKTYKNKYEVTNSKYKELKSFSNKIDQPFEIKQVKILSYVKFDDFTKVWLNYKNESDSIKGLILDNNAAGIVVASGEQSLGLLNGNEKANYAVYIGENKAPGITHDNKNPQFLTVKFIPIWIDIKINDEVITSGMDNIFYKGIKVGKVVAINKMADMQEAIIKPYAQVHKSRYLNLYEKKQIEEEIKTPIKKAKID